MTFIWKREFFQQMMVEQLGIYMGKKEMNFKPYLMWAVQNMSTNWYSLVLFHFRKCKLIPLPLSVEWT